MSNVNVVVRFRPQNSIENGKGGSMCVRFDDNKKTVVVEGGERGEANGPLTFTFDRVFDPTISQQQMYDFTAKAIVEDVLKGYNGTIFAYGQTGSGKTHTMEGPDIDDLKLKGMIPRIIENLFVYIASAPDDLEFSIRVSYFEIYLEKIKDLLDESKDNLQVHEDKGRGVYIKGLTEIYVGSPDEVMAIMRKGKSNRAVAATRMNADSSRSHSVIQIVVSQKNLQDGSAKSGRLSLVDLAGSEKVGKTGAEGQTLEEAKKINKSLSALGNVINSLTDTKASHIPYRDSKLTRVLQESLGGNSRTTIIINCSPSSYNAPETVSSLRFGARAKSIKNKARVNEELSAEELRRRWEDARKDVARLKGILAKAESELKVWRSGGTVAQAAWTSFASVADTDGGDDSPGPPAPLALPSSAVPAAAIAPVTPPASSLAEDERQEFIARENELVDEISEKDKMIADMRAELDVLRANKDGLDSFAKENANLAAEVSELQRRVDAILFENKELELTVESLNESKVALVTELASLKTALDAAHARLEDEGDSARDRAERVARMMESLDGQGQELEAREKQLRESLAESVSATVEEQAPPGPSVEELQAVQASLAAAELDLDRARQQVAHLEAQVESAVAAARQADRQRKDAEERADQLQTESQQMLGRMIEFESKAQIDEDNKTALVNLKKSLEDQIAAAKASHQKQLSDLREDLVTARAEADRLSCELSENHRAFDELQASNAQSRSLVEEQARKIIDMAKGMENRSRAELELEALKQATANQLKEFDQLKEALMTDLKNRCEKVIDLEISLDQSRDQYNQLLNSSANKAQQKKMAFLEKNLEQLTQVHQQLVNQNTQLKLDVAVAEKKLAARNSRIKHLEVLVQDAQEKLARQSARSRAETERLREQLAASKSLDARSRPFDWAPGAPVSANIAKPIRGGGRSGSFYLKSMMKWVTSAWLTCARARPTFLSFVLCAPRHVSLQSLSPCWPQSNATAHCEGICIPPPLLYPSLSLSLFCGGVHWHSATLT
eukprot:Opistho-2@36475